MSVPIVEFPQVNFSTLETEICLARDVLEETSIENDVIPEVIDTVVVDTKKIVEEFRESLKDVTLDNHLLSDPELLRWLNARGMDPKVAEEMLRNSLKWRQEHGIDEILQWEAPPKLVQEFPFQICGFDNDGDQFGIVTWSKWNITSLIESVPIDRGQTHIRYFWQCLEVVKKIMRANSTEEKAIHSGIVIIDMEGLAMWQFASRDVIEVVLEATRQYEANYPGFLKKAIVVNTPKVFTILFQLMRPFLSAETQASIEIYGYYDDWRGVLRNLVPVEQLPSRHGGANTTVQPFQPNQSYVVTIPQFDAIDELTLKNTTVPAGQKLDIDFIITEPNTHLSWAFRTDDYDIGFGVFRIPETVGDPEIEVVDFCRVDSHVLIQRGSIICKDTGKYIFRFDNVSSWIRPKILYYQISKVEK